jgi:hypothetical protein
MYDNPHDSVNHIYSHQLQIVFPATVNHVPVHYVVRSLAHARGVHHHAAQAHLQRAGQPGEAVQVEPMKPKLKPPGTQCLKLEYR